jgi:hypothetical protein
MSTGAFPPPAANAGTDWYAVLGVDAGAPEADIAAAAERLSRQASALANAAPDRSQQLRDTVRSIRSDLLSGPAARARYDDRLAATRAGVGQADAAPAAGAVPPAGVAPPTPYPPQSAPAPAPAPGTSWPGGASPTPGGPVPAAGPPAPGGPAVPGQPNVVDSVVAGIAPIASRFRRFLQSGWTCPNCGAEGGPGDKFCSKCGGPMKVQAPAPPPAPARAAVCPTCSTPVAPGGRFCAKCGTPVG